MNSRDIWLGKGYENESVVSNSALSDADTAEP